MTPPTPPPELWTVDQLAAYLHQSRTKTFQLIGDHEFETIKNGHHRLIVVDSVRAYVERKRAENRT